MEKKIFMLINGYDVYYILADNRLEILRKLENYDIANDHDDNEVFLIQEITQELAAKIILVNEDGNKYSLWECNLVCIEEIYIMKVNLIVLDSIYIKDNYNYQFELVELLSKVQTNINYVTILMKK